MPARKKLKKKTRVDPAPIEEIEVQLTPKEERFVEEFLSCCNATEAGMRSGLARNRHTAANEAYKLQNKPAVAAAIARGKKLYKDRLAIRRDILIGELLKLALSDIADVFDLKTFEVRQDIPFGASKAIRSISVKPTKDGPSVSIKMHDKIPAIDKLCHLLGYEPEAKDESRSAFVKWAQEQHEKDK